MFPNTIELSDIKMSTGTFHTVGRLHLYNETLPFQKAISHECCIGTVEVTTLRRMHMHDPRANLFCAFYMPPAAQPLPSR
jgi:hypothetical protein